MTDPRRPSSRRPTSEERRFLDVLCLYRGLYASRGPDDSRSATTLATAIGGAEMRMRALRMRDARMRRRIAG